MASTGNIKLNEGIPSITDAFVVIVKTEWNADIVDELANGAKKILTDAGIGFEEIIVPGAFEIPFTIQYLAKQKSSTEISAYIALATVIRGDTPHFDYVSKAITDGILELNLSLPTPVIYGVLTVNETSQAIERIGGIHGHKGEEAAITAIKMIDIVKHFNQRN